MKKKIILFAFASKDLIRSAEKLLSQTSDNFYDEINIFTSNKIDETLNLKLKTICWKERGFGYWIWKPYLIKKIFDKIGVDVGCHNKKIYLDLIIWILLKKW